MRRSSNYSSSYSSSYSAGSPRNPLFGSKNWEENIRSVVIEPCDAGEDALGYKAIFYLTFEAEQKVKKRSFEIGATYLVQRLHNLSKAGYCAPMTSKAIAAIEAKIGDALPMFLKSFDRTRSLHEFA